MGAATAGYCVGNLQLEGYPLVRPRLGFGAPAVVRNLT